MKKLLTHYIMVVIALCWLVPRQASAEEWTDGYITYATLSTSQVAVVGINIPDYSSDLPDSINIEIPSTLGLFMVTTIGRDVGVPVINSNNHTTKVRIVFPGTIQKSYAQAFSNTTNNISIEFKANNYLESLPKLMFENAKLDQLILPKGKWTKIPDYFAANSQIKTVVLPDNVREIGEYAFAQSDEEHPWIFTEFRFNKGLQKIGRNAFCNTSPRTSYRDTDNAYELRLPNSITEIGESSFEGMSGIYSLFIPGSIKKIPRRAFARWTTARYLTIDEGVERIEDEAFYQNGERRSTLYGTSITGVYNYSLPASVGYVGKNAFAKAMQLQAIQIPRSTPPATGGAVTDDYSGVYLSVPKTAYCLYAEDSNWNKYKLTMWKDNASRIIIFKNIKDGGDVKGEAFCSRGEATIVSATPAAGYKFVGWLRDGIVASAEREFRFTADGENIQLTAIFEPTGGSVSAKPDELYARIDYKPGTNYIFLDDISLRNGTEYADDWDFDLDVAYNDIFRFDVAYVRAEFIHAHPDKYPTQTMTFIGDGWPLEKVVNRWCFRTDSYLRLPVDKAFILKSEYDSKGNHVPSCTMKMYLPIINKKTSQRDTLVYTADVYMKDYISKPEISRGFNYDYQGDFKGLSVYQNNYQVMTNVSGLDTKKGFDVELNVTRRNNNVENSKFETVDTYNVSYGPGELTPDSKIFDESGENPGIELDLNTRYASASQMMYGTLAKDYNYMFTLRARNYDDNGKPGQWVQQTSGISGKYANPDDIDIYLGYSDGSITYDGKSAFSNKKGVEKYLKDNSGKSYILDAYTVNVRVYKYPTWWGKCEVAVENPDDPGSPTVIRSFSKVADNSSSEYRVPLLFPADGATHSFYVRWPEVGLEKEMTFTDCTPDDFPRYAFTLNLIGGGAQNIKDLYMVYKTADGEINGKLIKHADWFDTKWDYSRAQTIMLNEKRVITRIISLTDSVPEGTAHSVILPASLDNVKPLSSSLLVGKKVTERTTSSLCNTMNLYGFTDLYFKLVDASTGKQIKSGITLENSYSYAVQPDGTVKLQLYNDQSGSPISDHSGLKPIINADGYVPYFFGTEFKVDGHTISADGYLGYADADNKVTITIPMRRRIAKRPFDVVSLCYRTPGIEEPKDVYTEKEFDQIEWTSASYVGANSRIAYEGGFRPALENHNWDGSVENVEQPTLRLTIVYYDTDYKWVARENDRDNRYGPASYLTLRNESGTKKKIYPANWFSDHGDSDPGPIWDEKEGIKYYSDYNANYTFTHNTGYKYTYITYDLKPQSFVKPETEEKVYVSLKSGDEIALGYFKNLTEDALYMSKYAETEAPVGQEHVSDMCSGEDLERFNDAFDKFKVDMPDDRNAYGVDDYEIELPTDVVLPFNVGVQKLNNSYVVRGVMSWNFLPGGQAMDMIDKASFLADMDNVFYNIQRAVTHDKTEYAREDRALGFPTAFVGLRGWLEGRFVKDASGHYVPRASGIGIKTEASGFVRTGLNTPLFKAEMSLSGETSTYVALEYPDEADYQWGVKTNANFMHDVVQHTTVSLGTSFNIGAGIDIYIARAICGVKGSLSASFDSEIRYKPYLKGARKLYNDPNVTDKPDYIPSSYTYSGSRMKVAGDLKAYAEAKFLFWKARYEHRIASFDKTWYDPDDMTNPLKKRDSQDDAKTVTTLRSSVYKPLKLSAAPENTKILLSDVDTYAEPRYMFGGTDMAYYKINAADMTDSHMLFRSGKLFNSGIGEPIVTADMSSTDDKGIMAYEVSTAPEDKINDADESPKYVGIKASVYNGTSWSAPTMLSGADLANYTPRTAIDESGRAAVAWKGGEFKASGYMEKTGGVEGNLYLKQFDGTKWGDAITVTPTKAGASIGDYSMAMLGGKPYMLATLGTTEYDYSEGDVPKYTLASMGYDSGGNLRFVVNNDMLATNPQLVNFSGRLFGAALVDETDKNSSSDEKTKFDIHLYSLADDGMVSDLGALGLRNRNIDDFRLIKSDKAMALVWRESTQLLDEKNDMLNITPGVYGALIRSAKNDKGQTTYFISCPQLIAKSEGGLDISFYDAYLPDESSITGAVTFYDSETGGANVVEGTNYFDNDFTIRHAGIDTQVERGTDFGYYAVVFNEGKDVIDYVDMKLGDESVTKTFNVSIYPGHSEVLSDLALYTPQLENGVVPVITPHFNASGLQTRSYEQARVATLGARKVNRRRPRMKAAQAAPAIQLQSVDMKMTPLSTFIEGGDNYYVASADTVINVGDDVKDLGEAMPDKYTVVLLNVMNESPVSLKPDYRTHIALYHDINGQKPYEYANETQISAAEFAEQGNSAVACLLVGKVPESVMLYAVAYTLDGFGNVVNDQNLNNNATAVYLEKNDLQVVPNGVEEVVADDDSEQKKFTVSCNDYGATVEGLQKGQTLRVYDMRGALQHLYKVESEGSHTVRLKGRGIYIFSTRNQSEKIAF